MISPFRSVWKPNETPKVFVTDRDKALRNALAKTFPDATLNVCLWHIDQNIVANCKRHFSNDDGLWEDFIKKWHSVVYATDEDSYEIHWRNLEKTLADRSQVLDYITKNIIPARKLFMARWAGKTPHLGNISSSRAESGHSFLKLYVKNSRGSMAHVFDTLAAAVDHQIDTCIQHLNHESVKGLSGLPKVFQPLHTTVSTHALKLAVTEYAKLCKIRKGQADPTDQCTDTFSNSMGIPCAHKMAVILDEKGNLEPDDFHSQWVLAYNPDGDVSHYFFLVLLRAFVKETTDIFPLAAAQRW